MSKNVIINARFLTQPITGTQRFALELCKEIKLLRPDISLVAPDNILHKDIAEELEVQIIGRIKKGLLWEQIELPWILRQKGNPLLINLCNMAPITYDNNIVTVLDLSFHLHPEWFSKKFRTLYNFFVPRAAIKAQKVLTISESSKQDIIKHFKIEANKIDIIYPSVSKIFLESINQTFENKYGDYILAVSSIDPRKNFKSLIQAFKIGDFGETKLLIVGSEHKVFADNDLKELVANDPRIIFTGYVDDIQLVGLYKNALLFAYPSYFEGFGIPPLEAMACGCPTVVSNTTSLPEVCGDASIYVNPYDINNIKDGLKYVIQNNEIRSQLIAKGYTQLTKFNWRQSAKKIIKIIEQV